MTDSNFSPVSHCIFDMDGLLLDTEQLYTQIFQSICAPYGKSYTWEHKAKIMGFKTAEVGAAIIEMLNLPITAEEFQTQALSAYKEMFPRAKPLPDSERKYKIIFGTICQKYGYTYDADIAVKVLGRPERASAELIINHYKLPLNIEQFLQIYHQLQREIFTTSVDLMPGASRLLHHLKEHKIPIALATSSSAESYELKTKNVKEIFELFEHRVLGGTDPDVKRGKPSPDIFLVAASRFSDIPNPDKCLVFEDAPNGVQAAIAAGMQVVMVPDPNLPRELTTKATQVLNSLEEFKPEQFGLPPFSS